MFVCVFAYNVKSKSPLRVVLCDSESTASYEKESLSSSPLIWNLQHFYRNIYKGVRGNITQLNLVSIEGLANKKTIEGLANNKTSLRSSEMQ